jgi:hypothetical protein
MKNARTRSFRVNIKTHVSWRKGVGSTVSIGKIESKTA